MSIRATILVALLASLLPAQDLEQRRDAVREFERYFRKYKTVEERVAAVRTLEGMECPEAAEQLRELLDHKEPEVGRTALDVLAGYREAATFEPMIEALPEVRGRGRQARWIEALGRARISAAAPALCAIALEDGGAGAEVRREIARALAEIGGEASAPALRALLADGEPLVRLAACDAAARLRLRAVAPEVLPLLDDPVWQVQSAAVKAVGALRAEAAIAPLIALMRSEGRIQQECSEALFQITALDLGVDPDLWERSWARLQSTGWRLPTDEELARAAQSRRRYDELYGKAQKTAFGGVVTTSTRVLFLVDVSGSMDELVVERERFDAGYADFRKLTIVKAELLKTIESLGPDTLFNIVAFASDVDAWKKQPVPANIVNKSSAKTWVERLKPLGAGQAGGARTSTLPFDAASSDAGKTNTFKALMYPFGIDPQASARAREAAERSAMQNRLDTVFFLSDGRPSTGALVDTREILAEVRRTNEAFNIAFHAIAIGDFQKDFLRSLAQDNGGVFVDLGR